MSIFTRIGNEELEATIVPEEATTQEIIENNIESSEVSEEISDIQTTFTDIETASELQEELENKVASVEMLKEGEYNLYVANDLHASYVKACGLMGMEPRHISNESMDNAIALSTEGIKEVIINIVNVIKQIVGKIINKIRQLWIKIQTMLNSDEKTLHTLAAELRKNLADKNLHDENIIKLQSVWYGEKDLLHKLYKRTAGLNFITGEKGESYFPNIVNGYIKLISTIGEQIKTNKENGLDLGDISISAVPISNAILNYTKKKFPDTKNGIKLARVRWTSITGNTLNCLLEYWDDSDKSPEMDYMRVPLSGLMGGEKMFSDYTFSKYGFSATKHYKFYAMDQFTLVDIEKLVKALMDSTKGIKNKYDEMNKNIDIVNKHLKEVERYYNNDSDAVNVKQNLNQLKKVSIILPRIYLDTMSSLLHINKTGIMILTYANNALKK